MPRHPLPPIPGALRALAPLSPAQRRWLLATDGAVEAGLTPAGLAAAATWAHTEAVSTETLAALVPGAVAVTPPADVPGSALMVDIAHLVWRGMWVADLCAVERWWGEVEGGRRGREEA